MKDYGPYLEVPLTRGKVVKVSPEDHARVTRHMWFYNGDSSPYAARHTGLKYRQRKVYLHRWLCPAPDGLVINHDNGDTLDCRRPNLIPRTHRQNSTVDRVRKGLVGYIGVWRRTDRRKNGSLCVRYRAAIIIGLDRIHLGTFKTPEDAARAYDRRAVQAFGVLADTNFPLTDYLSPVTLREARLSPIPDPPF